MRALAGVVSMEELLAQYGLVLKTTVTSVLDALERRALVRRAISATPPGQPWPRIGTPPDLPATPVTR